MRNLMETNNLCKYRNQHYICSCQSKKNPQKSLFQYELEKMGMQHTRLIYPASAKTCPWVPLKYQGLSQPQDCAEYSSPLTTTLLCSFKALQ